MKKRIGLIIGWICAILIAAYNGFAAVMKIIPQAPESEGAKFMHVLGISPTMAHILAVMELVIIVLFLIPRTSTIGFILMVGYLGGAFATNLTHGFSGTQDIVSFLVVFAVLAVSAYFRNPELLTRLKKGSA